MTPSQKWGKKNYREKVVEVVGGWCGGGWGGEGGGGGEAGLNNNMFVHFLPNLGTNTTQI
jgi:hypothetical protein